MRLDRSVFKVQSFHEAENTRAYWLTKSPDERFQAAWYLICSAWNIDAKNPPRLDKTYFSSRKNG